VAGAREHGDASSGSGSTELVTDVVHYVIFKQSLISFVK
jgi:hypothetical protein